MAFIGLKEDFRVYGGYCAGKIFKSNSRDLS